MNDEQRKERAVKRENQITIKLNDREYQMILDLMEKFNSNKKLPFREMNMSDIVRICILWEHEKLIQHKD